MPPPGENGAGDGDCVGTAGSDTTPPPPHPHPSCSALIFAAPCISQPLPSPNLVIQSSPPPIPAFPQLTAS